MILVLKHPFKKVKNQLQISGALKRPWEGGSRQPSENRIVKNDPGGRGIIEET